MTHTLQDPRIGRVLSKALQAVRPERLVSNYMDEHPLPPHKRLFILAIGKAAEGMARAAAERATSSGTLVITKQALRFPAEAAAPAPAARDPEQSEATIEVLEAGHPIPDKRSVEAGQAVARFVSQVRGDDLLLCLISGGGSALVAAPVPGVSLDDLRQLTDELLRSGANIQEINVVRTSLDTLKGGGLAAASSGHVLSLILSDVIGDRLDTIASGMTASTRPGPGVALSILDRYGIQVPGSIIGALDRPDDHRAGVAAARVQNVIIGNNCTSRLAAVQQAQLEGLSSMMDPVEVQGEAADAGRGLARQLVAALESMRRPFCIVAGGETTVSMGRGGLGGRNQEMALAAVEPLAGTPNILFITMATDGNDGPTDAAGAVVSGETQRRARQRGISGARALAQHDSYHFFDEMGDLLRTGYTGTNVNDLMLLVGL